MSSIDLFLLETIMLTYYIVFTVATQFSHISTMWHHLLERLIVLVFNIKQSPRHRQYKLRISSRTRAIGGSLPVDVSIFLPSVLMVLSAIMISSWFLFLVLPFWAIYRRTNNLFTPNSFDPLTFRKPPYLPSQVFYSLPGTSFVVSPNKFCFPNWVYTLVDLFLFYILRVPHDTSVRKKTAWWNSIPFYSGLVLTSLLRQTVSAAVSHCDNQTVFALASGLRKFPQKFQFDSDSVLFHVDNCTSTTLWNKRSHFSTLRPLTETERQLNGIRGIGGILYPDGIGTLEISIDDDQGHPHTLTVEDALFVPANPFNLFCPQQWAIQRQQLHHDKLAHCDTRGNHVLLEWRDSGTDFSRHVPVDPSTNVFQMYTSAGYLHYLAHATVCCPTVCMAAPTVVSSYDDTSSTNVSEAEGDSVSTDSDTTFEAEGATPLRSDPLCSDFSNLQDPHVIPPEPSPATAPDDTPITLGDKRLLMEYHERFGHISWDIIQILAELRLIPRRLARVLKECGKPKCPGCLYGKQHKKPWRGTRSKLKQKRIKLAKKAGDVVSVDQLESSVAGLVPQVKGILTTRRYTAATVFVDHFSSLTYVHLMESTTGEETVQAKEAFERYAKENEVKVRHYHADNGRFAEKLFTDHVRLSDQTIS